MVVTVSVVSVVAHELMLRLCCTTGCDLLFTDETIDGTLNFFPLPGATTATQKTVNVPENKTCNVKFGDSLYVQYLACDGTWQQVPSQQALANFEVTPGWSSSRLVIRVGVW